MEENVINKKAFGKKIKEAREKLGMTQLQLAEEINVSQNFLGDIERGIKLPSLSKLIYLSNVLKISLDSMFSDSLNNILNEPDGKYYSDRQIAIIKNLIKNITDNF